MTFLAPKGMRVTRQSISSHRELTSFSCGQKKQNKNKRMIRRQKCHLVTGK